MGVYWCTRCTGPFYGFLMRNNCTHPPCVQVCTAVYSRVQRRARPLTLAPPLAASIAPPLHPSAFGAGCAARSMRRPHCFGCISLSLERDIYIDIYIHIYLCRWAFGTPAARPAGYCCSPRPTAPYTVYMVYTVYTSLPVHFKCPKVTFVSFVYYTLSRMSSGWGIREAPHI